MKIKKILGFRAIVVFVFLASSLLMLGNIAAVFAQGVPPSEICNGIDDNGDGKADEGLNCDHYLTYLLDKPINPIDVVLKDQFINPTDFRLVSIERLFNPVRKIHNGMVFKPSRPDLHYLAYRIQTPVPFTPRSVIIENQFEKRTILATKPRYLLTPTGKNKIGIPIERIMSTVKDFVADKLIATIVPPIPKNANHYLCYDIEPYNIAAGVSLKDQFQNRQFEVIRAKYLCNPVKKIHNGKASDIIDENNHIVCYEVIPHNQVNRKVMTQDQFGIKSQQAIRTEELCLPTKKSIPTSSCVQPDQEGTAVVFDESFKYQNTEGQFTVIEASLSTAGVSADGILMSGPDTVIIKSGNPNDGEIYTFDTEMLQMTLSGSGRVLNLPLIGSISVGARTPGEAVQSFDTEMLQLQGQLPPGDPDFDLLRITAGSGFGLPSPGHTTLTQLPSGNWHVDSFFDITYRIDFVGSPGGLYAGQSGSTTGTIRLVNACQDQND